MRVSFPLLACLSVLPTAVPAQVAFSPPTAYNAGAIPEALAAHDLDRDGDVDLTVVDRQGHLRLLLGTSSGALELIEVQPPGGRPMSAGDYLRGHGAAIVG